MTFLHAAAIAYLPLSLIAATAIGRYLKESDRAH